MKSIIHTGILDIIILNGVCFCKAVNCFSAIYFASHPKGCKLLKINSSFRIEAKTKNYIYIL